MLCKEIEVSDIQRTMDTLLSQKLISEHFVFMWAKNKKSFWEIIKIEVSAYNFITKSTKYFNDMLNAKKLLEINHLIRILD
jgi:hypothetical protein